MRVWVMLAKQNVTKGKLVQNLERREHHLVVEFQLFWYPKTSSIDEHELNDPWET